MIVKKLRSQKNWSQEQLASLSGLSLRTVQRVEAGNKASLETLKSLASVFDIEISKLTEEIIVIDKDAQSWKDEPFWVRVGAFGTQKRWQLVAVEYILLAMGVAIWWFDPNNISVIIAFIGAYLNTKVVGHIDKKRHW